ncbi:MAG TPA: CBS domain-containing protein [Nitrospiria bacterium]
MELLSMLVNKNIITIDEKVTAQEAARTMRDKKIGSLIVTQGEKEAGIISETDLARKAVADGMDAQKTPVSALMSSPIISIEINETPERANEVMKQEGIRHLGITENGKLVGIISVRDLLRYFKVYYDGIGSLKGGK